MKVSFWVCILAVAVGLAYFITVGLLQRGAVPLPAAFATTRWRSSSVPSSSQP